MRRAVLRWHFLARVLLAFLAAAGGGWVGAQPPARPDSAVRAAAVVAEAEQDGRRDAATRSVSGRAAVGFVGGLPVGLFGVFAFADGGAGIIPAAAGVGVVSAASRGAATLPEPAQRSAAARGGVYERAYVESYRRTLQARRRRAAWLGGAAGAAAGLIVLLALVSQVTT